MITLRQGSRVFLQRSSCFARKLHVDSSTESIQEVISKNTIVVFAKSTCPFCYEANEVLKEELLAANSTAEIVTVKLNEMSNGGAVQDLLFQMTGQTTVPNIFIQQKHIGGCDDLMALARNGELISLLLSE